MKDTRSNLVNAYRFLNQHFEHRITQQLTLHSTFLFQRVYINQITSEDYYSFIMPEREQTLTHSHVPLLKLCQHPGEADETH